MAKQAAGFPTVRKRLSSVLENIQRSHTQVVKHSTTAGARVRHQPRLIVTRRLTEAKAGEGPGGKTLARNPSTSTTRS
tara:strand:+ start:817 stop:1050 length:234 start_codon:yes stop_codon:yes gene_type:complete